MDMATAAAAALEAARKYAPPTTPLVLDPEVFTDGDSYVFSAGHPRFINDDDGDYMNPDMPSLWVNARTGHARAVWFHLTPAAFDRIVPVSS